MDTENEKVLEAQWNNFPHYVEEGINAIVVSDMEIDRCFDYDWTFYDAMKVRYESLGYELPNIVF